MSWATEYITKLDNDEIVQFRPQGNSMTGLVESGQLVTVEPCFANDLKVNDVVLCQIGRSQYLHLIKKIVGDKFVIGNNKGAINGVIDSSCIYGKLIKVED